MVKMALVCTSCFAVDEVEAPDDLVAEMAGVDAHYCERCAPIAIEAEGLTNIRLVREIELRCVRLD
jgi:hypothetical protein